jgi:ferredoxin
VPKLEFVHRVAGALRVTEAQVPTGSTLLAAARQAGLPVARACGARAQCGRCGLRVLGGAGALAPETEAERRTKRRNRVDPEERLACACRVHGEARLTATYW